MKYCIHCGKQLPEEAAFCERCGKPVGAGNAPAQQPVQTIPPRDLKKEAASRRRPVVGVLLILAAVAIVVAVILMAIAQYRR